jgi:sugar lactone lactonase YvrE
MSGVELIVDGRAGLAEGPVWDDRIGRLWWVDIHGGNVHRLDPTTGADETVPVGRPVATIGLRSSGGIIAAAEDGLGWIDVGAGAYRTLVRISADGRTRMNDGKPDPVGRFWVGTMAYDERPGAGALYRIEPDLAVATVLPSVTVSNGLDWTDDGRTMYYIDTATGAVDRFAVDLSTGEVSDRRHAIVIPPDQGVPDGMTLDVEGHLWVALYDGWAIHRYAPDGRLDRRIAIPAAQVTSVAFGGADLDELFVTTAREGFPTEGRPGQPHAGGVFRCRPGVRGRPANRFAG